MSEGVSPEQRRDIVDACQRLVLDWAYAGDIEHALREALISERTVFRAPGVDIKGKAAILARRSAGGLATMHCITNIRVDVEGPDSARGVAYLTATAGKAGEDGRAVVMQVTRGVYRDRYERESDGWKIIERSFEPLFEVEERAEG